MSSKISDAVFFRFAALNHSDRNCAFSPERRRFLQRAIFDAVPKPLFRLFPLPFCK